MITNRYRTPHGICSFQLAYAGFTALLWEAERERELKCPSYRHYCLGFFVCGFGFFKFPNKNNKKEQTQEACGLTGRQTDKQLAGSTLYA